MNGKILVRRWVEADGRRPSSAYGTKSKSTTHAKSPYALAMADPTERDILDAITIMATELETLKGESLQNPQVQAVGGWAKETTGATEAYVKDLLSKSARSRAMAAEFKGKPFPQA